MMIAIHRIAKSVRRDGNLAESLNQNMLILHQVTFTLYLLALITYCIVYAYWDAIRKDAAAVYITAGISSMMSAISQGVLIFIYWGLAAEVTAPKDQAEK